MDAHSKWPEVIPTTSTTSQTTIHAFRGLFASYGLPWQLVSDNGIQLTSEEFDHFLPVDCVKHILSSPYHPSTNGAVEWFVGSLKQALRSVNSADLHFNLMSFLMTYRTTPHATTNASPCELFFKRHIRTRLDLFKPDLQKSVMEKQCTQKSVHDLHGCSREFFIGQRVLAQNYWAGPRWVPVTVVERRGPLTYLVLTEQDLLWKRHWPTTQSLKLSWKCHTSTFQLATTSLQ